MRIKLPLIAIFILTGSTLFSAVWTQTTDSDFSGGDTVNSEVSGTGNEAAIQLKTLSSIQSGCTFRADAVSSFALDSAGKKYSVRFTAQNTQTLASLNLCGNITGSLAIYRVGVQTNNAGTDAPTGVWVDSGLFDISTAVNGWQTVVMTGVTSLTAGEKYHLVIEKDSGTTDASHNFAMFYTTPQAGMTSYNETRDTSLSILESTDGGSSWTDRAVQPMYVLQGAAAEGSVYYTKDTSSQIYGARYYGEKISVTGAAKIVKRVSFYVKASTVAPPPDDHLYVTLQNVTDGVDVETVKLVDKTNITGSYEWYSADLSQPMTLAVGKVYRLFLKSPYSSNARYYAAYRAQGYDISTADIDAVNYGGAGQVYTENTGSGWVENVDRYDILFKLFSATYNTSGTFTSSIFDAGYSASFSSLSWTPPVQTAGTSISLQLASSNSELGPWTYSGPDGTADTYYTNAGGFLAGGAAVSGAHAGKRFIRYKANLSTTDAAGTPVLTSVSVTYAPRSLPGSALQSIAYPVPYDPGAGNMTISYMLSRDSRVTLKVYSSMGDLVRSYEMAAGTAGGKGAEGGYNNTVTWDGRNGDGMKAASGAYVIHITAEPADGSATTTETKKILIIR